MEVLSKERFGAARAYVEEHGRPLEQARLRHRFDGGGADEVTRALAAYANVDGGFGNGLEPDLQTSLSSVLCTSIAFQVLRSIGASPDERLVINAMGYLQSTFDGTSGHFRAIPRGAEREPHAPWWNQRGREAEFDRFSFNPTAEILGYLYDYGVHVAEAFREAVRAEVLERLAKADRLEMHELLCCLRLSETKGLPDQDRAVIRAAIAARIDDAVAVDEDAWDTYGLRPLQLVGGPQSPFLDRLADAVERNLDYEITGQNADGSWRPNWTWGDAYPTTWQRAKAEWTSVVTLEHLMRLEAFGRIEGRD